MGLYVESLFQWNDRLGKFSADLLSLIGAVNEQNLNHHNNKTGLTLRQESGRKVREVDAPDRKSVV